MNFKKLLVCAGLIGVSAFGVGCGDDDDAPPGTPDMGTPCNAAALMTGASHLYVVNVLSVAGIEDDGTTAGFNVDGDSVIACNDLTAGTDAELNGAPPDNGTGVDNGLGATLAGFAGTAVQENIDDASLLLLVNVRGVDSFTADSCVGVTFYLGLLPAGTAVPELGADMRLAPDQVFDLQALSFVDGVAGTMPRIEFGAARIVAGRLQAGPADFPLTLSLGGTEIAVTIRDAQLRFNISATGMTEGRLGGSLNTDEVVAAIGMIDPPPVPPATAADILGGLADIDTNGSPESCEAGSIALKLGGVPAMRGEIVAEPAPTDGGTPMPDAGPRDGGARDGGARDGGP